MNERLRRIAATATLLIGLTLAGCSGSPPAFDAQLSENWQTRVVAIADHAAAGDHAMALEELAVLEREAAEARESGSISAERAAIIQQSIALVRADLESATVDTTVPEPAQTEEPVVNDPAPDTENGGGDGDGGESDTGGTPGDNGNGNDGNNGNGNDGNNGNGNDGNRGNSGKGGSNRPANNSKGNDR